MPKGPQGQQRPSVVIGKDVHIALIATGKTQELELNRHSKSKSDLAKADARFDNTAPGLFLTIWLILLRTTTIR